MLEVQKIPRSEMSSMLLTILNDEKRLGLSSDNEAAFLSLQLIVGAADTSRMSTWSWLEAMMMFPAIQAEARAEIDKSVGDRIPMWADFENSSYFRGMMKELWRWRPPVALGHPHTTTRNLEYNGMRIPQGWNLHLNAWAIGHDPVRHPDPERFNPRRFIDDPLTAQQSINLPVATKRDHFTFGAGRRLCPGVDTVPTLPWDNHMLHALYACPPRGWLIIENTAIYYLGPTSNYRCATAGRKVHEALGVKDYFGFSQNSHSDHCEFPKAQQQPELTAFIERFLIAKVTTTDVWTTDGKFAIDPASELKLRYVAKRPPLVR